MFEPCPTCGGSGKVPHPDPCGHEWHETCVLIDCPACVGGRVVSESVIEEMIARGLDAATQALRGLPILGEEAIRAIHQAMPDAARVVLEHMEDNE